MIRNLSAAFAAGALIAYMGTAHAADAQRGAALAQQWCVNCHVIGSNTQTTTQQGPPTLRSVSGMAPDQLRGFLIKPHGEMPDLSLSRSEIDDLIAYIGSLK